MPSQDKLLHFVVGAVIFSAVYVLFPNLLIAGGAVILAAIGKEVYDYIHRDRHTPDMMDAVATVIGGAVCALPVLIH